MGVLILTTYGFAVGRGRLPLSRTPMHQTQHITSNREMDEDPEYGFREEAEADTTLMSLEKLQLLVIELHTLRRVRGVQRRALERVCDYVVHDPVYADSTRSIFQSALENIHRHSAG